VNVAVLEHWPNVCCHQNVIFLRSRAALDRQMGMHMPNDPVDFGLLIRPDIPARSFKAGETIFNEGEPGTELYVIQSGRVRIQTGNRLLNTLDANDIFGEMALIDSAPRSATAIAETAVTLVPVSEKQFLFLVSQTPFFALKVMRVLARRLNTANKAI
jgi:CRP/FNR family transcriptional regulator, cyclic AMP receptor protein